VRALLISTYDLGRQPFGLASPAAWLTAAGWTVDCADMSRETLADDRLRSADIVGFYLPMHTATRLALPVVERVRRARSDARVCAYGVYAALAAETLRSAGVDRVFGGEFERELVEWAGGASREPEPGAAIPRLRFLVPDRRALPPLDRYATLQLADGERRTVGYTEASRGCRHRCRHCPIVPVYDGQFRIVQADVVLADIDAQIAAGARHITFGDPDFFNGPTHAIRLVEALHGAHPDATYDVTIKVEHLLDHRDLLPRLAATGCAFVTSAVESIDDRVLAILDKGHTRADFVEAVTACRAAGLELAPTFVAFHPWITLEGYCDLLDTIEALDLVSNVAPIQLAIRLLIPEGSRLLEVADVRRLVDRFDPDTLTWRWAHADPRVDCLQQEIARVAGVQLNGNRAAAFERIRELAYTAGGRAVARTAPVRHRATVPYLNEPWYC
jgi:radical SAM superfamily enzyme YgiQ (UPF0313 family)